MDIENLRNIVSTLKGIIYAHRTHEIEVKSKAKAVTKIKWANIATTTLAIIALIVSIATDDMNSMDISRYSTYVSIGLMALSLALVLIRLNFNPEERLEKHRQIAREFLHMREKYRALVADIKNGTVEGDALMKRRDELINEHAIIYKLAPPTSAKAHEQAKREIKKDDLPQLPPEDDKANQ